ncbi:MAG: hypothetical protein SRB2_02727 [Desulfobacteraceae bacterium Eth-SRB2]|nr:MAG: hypothetical protein SRB2_02727 [Desulfobacteraceae bacterium Eth-SRB2]
MDFIGYSERKWDESDKNNYYAYVNEEGIAKRELSWVLHLHNFWKHNNIWMNKCKYFITLSCAESRQRNNQYRMVSFMQSLKRHSHMF